MADTAYRSLWEAVRHTAFSQGWLDARGLRTRDLHSGDASRPPLLLLHGVGGHAEAYLRNRGITADLAGTLRYHPDLWHGPSQMRLPAMIGWVAHPVHVAIHRTWLAPEGKGKAKVPSNKMMLGSVAGGAVQLMEGPGPLVVAEGIETALSLASGFLPHPMRLWAALSASGMRSLILPEQLSTLIIASDGDAVGRAAAQDLGLRSRTRGWTVKTFAAAEGKDWNDELLAQGDAK